MSSAVPDYLIVGHICADLQPDSSGRLGGSAVVAARAADAQNLRVAIATVCAPTLDLSALPSRIAVARQPASQSTVFENRYTAQGRVQRLHSQAPPVDLHTIPQSWLRAPIMHLAPIMQEVPLAALQQFDAPVTGVTPQGWLRTAGPDRIVQLQPARLLTLPWRRSHVVVLSDEDVQADIALVQQLAQGLDLLVLTRAERGATVFERGIPTNVPAVPITVGDPTGAGDVFAAVFFTALHQGRPAIDAAGWACAVAARAIARKE